MSSWVQGQLCLCRCECWTGAWVNQLHLTLFALQHGALEHPESFCYLCRWQFESPEVLSNHIKHFVNHPKCADCNLRFADAGVYQHVSLTIVTCLTSHIRHSTYSLYIARMPTTRQLCAPRQQLHKSSSTLKKVGFHLHCPPSATRLLMASLLLMAMEPILYSLLPSPCLLASVATPVRLLRRLPQTPRFNRNYKLGCVARCSLLITLVQVAQGNFYTRR